MSEWWANDPVAPPAKGEWWHQDEIAKPDGPSYAADMAKGAGAGLVKGAVGLAGLPGAIEDATNFLARQSAGRVGNLIRGQGFTAPTFDEMEKRRAEMGLGSQKALPSIDTLLPAVERNVTGKLYEAQTVPGQYAQTIGEFIPGMALPGGSLMQRGAMAVVPAVASETAGQATKGTPAEPYARAGAAIGTGLGMAGLSAMRRQPVQNTLHAVTRGMDDATVTAAETLMQNAATRGVTLTWDEALAQVSGGAVNMANMRRVVENSAEGGAVLNPLMAQRPGQIAQAASREADAIAPATAAPSAIGPQAGAAAEGIATDIRQTINRVSEPFYNAAAPVVLGQQEMVQVMALPGVPAAIRAVRADPQLNRNVANLPNNSVGFLNEVKKYLDTAAENASAPVNAQRNMQRSAGYSQDASAVRNAAEAASPDYAAALQIQSQGREQYLKPLLEGPIGRIAQKDITTQKAIDAMFPRNPLANSAEEISTAMGQLSAKSPAVARQLLRAHAEQAFSEAFDASRTLQGGQFAGARAAFDLRGSVNGQRGQNLEAAVRATPNGDEIWTGFNRFLDIAEATGMRPAQGSATAFNAQIQDAMKAGSVAGEVVQAVRTGGLKVPSRLTQWYQNMQFEKNAGNLASILADPNAVGVFRALAKDKLGVPASVALATRLTYMGDATVGKPNANAPGK